MSRFFTTAGFFIELVLNFPGFILCFLIFFISKNEKLADKIVDTIVGKGLTWGFSIVVWLTLWLVW